MKKKILWLGLSFLLVAALVLTACPAPVVEEPVVEEPVVEEPVVEEPVVEEPVVEEPVVEEEKLDFMVISAGNLDNPWIAELYSGWEAAVEILGVNSMVGMGDFDYAKMIDAIDLGIAAGVDGILIHNWMDPLGTVPSIQRAHELGIHIVLVGDRPPEFTEKEVPRVGLIIYNQGYTTGLDLAVRLEAAGVSEVIAVCPMGSLTAPVEYDRRDGIMDALADSGIDATVESIEVGADISICVDKIKAHLIAYPETNVVLGTGSITTPAGVMALTELGYEPGDGIFWTGFDLDPETEVAVRAGWGAVNVDEVFGYGFLGAISIYMRLEHDLIVGNLPVATVMIDQDNIDEYTD